MHASLASLPRPCLGLLWELLHPADEEFPRVCEISTSLFFRLLGIDTDRLTSTRPLACCFPTLTASAPADRDREGDVAQGNLYSLVHTSAHCPAIQCPYTAGQRRHNPDNQIQLLDLPVRPIPPSRHWTVEHINPTIFDSEAAQAATYIRDGVLREALYGV